MSAPETKSVPTNSHSSATEAAGTATELLRDLEPVSSEAPLSKKQPSQKAKSIASELAAEQDAQAASGFPLVALCFFLSGLAALVYQTAWMRQFSVVFGTSEPAVATVLAAYMSGLALGAWVAGRMLAKVRRPVMTYALLELGVALGALFVPVGLKIARALQASIFGGAVQPPDAGAWNHVAFYLVTAFVLVLVPTSFMGATLPLLVQHAVRKGSEISKRSGALYSINTVGAVFGALGGAFFLLPRLGLMGTIWAGVAINALVFVLATRLKETARPSNPFASDEHEAKTARRPAIDGRGRVMLFAIFFSGAVSFTYEVLWTRMLGHVLGGSLFAFAIMLSSFLVGIALGSAIASRKGKTRDDAARGFATAQIGAAVGAILVWFALGMLPQFSAGLGIGEDAGLFTNAGVALALMLPATLCIGVTFPFAIRLVAKDAEAAGDASARVVAWNTVGATCGALFAGFWLVPALEFEGATKVAVLANLALAVAGAFCLSTPEARKKLGLVCAAALVLCTLGFKPKRPDGILLASSVYELQTPSPILYADVGPSATVLVTTFDKVYQVRVNGLPQAAITKKGGVEFTGRHQRWLAALPLVARPAARSMLIIGLGGGVAAESLPPSVEEIDIMELSPEVVEANHFLKDLRDTDPLEDARINLIENDARSALSLSSKQWDVIVSQPSHPWTAGASHLFTTEFVQLAKDRLTEDGVYLQWMSTRGFDEELLATYAATLLEVFPFVRTFQTSSNTLLFLSSEGALDFEQDLAKGEGAIASLTEYLAGLGVESAEDIVAMVRLDQEQLEALAEGSEPSTDDKNRLATRGARLRRAEASSDMNARIVERSVLSDPEAAAWTKYGFDPGRVAIRCGTLGMIEQADAIASGIEDPLERSLTGAMLARAMGRPDIHQRMIAEARTLNPDDERLVYLEFEALLTPDPDAKLGSEEEVRIRLLGRAPRAVIEAWPDFVSGAHDSLESFESELAQSKAGAVWDRLAQQLRVTWRLYSARENGRSEHAEQALDILDKALADGPNLSLLAMRCEAAALCDKPHVLLESADYASRSISERGVDASVSYWAGRMFMALSTLIELDDVDDRVDELIYHEVRSHLQRAATMGQAGQ